MSTPRAILRAVGSLWFAACLIVLLLVGMACATVVESDHGTERALAEFYGSWWFTALLTLVAVNVLAAVLLRYPFRKRQIGFVLTHGGILLTLGGALVTQIWGVNGRVGLTEGESTDRFTLGGRDTLTVTRRHDQAEAALTPSGRTFGGLDPVDQPNAPPLSLGNLRVEVERYLPDSIWTMQVTDDHPHPRPAVKVSLSPTGLDDPEWLFADETGTVATLEAAYLVVNEEAELQRLLNYTSKDQPVPKGTVRIEYHGATFEFPMEEGLDHPVPLGDTGYTARVLRYLPHARVENNELINASNRPVNPTIEVELASPATTVKRFAFALFPEFNAMHAKGRLEEFDLAFVIPEDIRPRTPLEVIGGPGGSLYARFSPNEGDAIVKELAVGTPVETPWLGWKFAVLNRYERARVDWSVTPTDELRDPRIPAVLVRLATPDQTTEVWVQKYRPRSATVGRQVYDLNYASQSRPLGFSLTLNRFHIGRYPGSGRPRSFESHVTITDPTTAREQDRVISMNNPTSHGGYALFQSDYSEAGGQRASILSVSCDPGQPIVFAGYVVMMVGMAVILVTRMLERRWGTRAGPEFAATKVTP